MARGAVVVAAATSLGRLWLLLGEQIIGHLLHDLGDSQSLGAPHLLLEERASRSFHNTFGVLL